MQHFDLPGSGAIWTRLGCKVLRLVSDQNRTEEIRSFGFQKEYLRPTTSISLTKRNLVTIETSQQRDWMVDVEKINSK